MSSYIPPYAFHFSVKFFLDGIHGNHREADFESVSGISRTIGSTAFHEGGVNDRVYNLPTPATYGDASLKRGVYLDSKLHDWFVDAIEYFNILPRLVVIELLGHVRDSNGNPIDGLQPVIKWRLEDAYPISWTPSGLDANSSAFLMETIVLKYQKMTREVISY